MKGCGDYHLKTFSHFQRENLPLSVEPFPRDYLVVYALLATLWSLGTCTVNSFGFTLGYGFDLGEGIFARVAKL